MSSAAPTAYALMQTGDKKCLEFLSNIVDKFNGGAPFVYPVELYERLWVVDRLERLGISSYFRSEIDKYLDYAYSFGHWSKEGLGFTRDCTVRDIDDTAMGFRLLPLHGYRVSPDVFEHFEKDGEFVVYPGQSNQSVSAMHNLYRAAFPGDDGGVLGRAKSYSRAFLQERRASGRLNDKWIISSGLPGEVAYALDFPWKASLPRVEMRMYLEQYGGSANAWIGKSTVRAYFVAAANIFEPDRAVERLGWAHTVVLAQAVSSCFMRKGVKDLAENGLIHVLHELINLLAPDNASRDSLREAWKKWLVAWPAKESLESCGGNTALLLVRTIETVSGRHGTAGRNLNRHSEYSQLESITSSICNKLSKRVQNGETRQHTEDLERQVDQEMQELAQCVLQSSNSINRMTRQTFLDVAKSYCYMAHCSPEIIENHISKVIFEDVM
ncbi:syn-copalyl diphosphate synthase-like [Panicum miliaceum]|uniref:Syn-copalyl diphosphate synthase-like n=1 Tax=Panicum miliaceum TaxID=4540 RepID=A0A3L6RMR7_PANMI|nr:syn-copalyl diphosphate synthase-like [Panicum miliaceum]